MASDDTVARDGTSEAARIRRLYEKGSRPLRDIQLQYQENSCYVERRQWVWRNTARQEINELPRQRWRVRATVPRIGPASRRIVARALRRPLRFKVTPNGADDASVRGARIAEAVITAKAREDKWERIREEITWAVWKGGTGILCVDWDASKGRYVGVSPDQGPLYQGDARLVPLTICEVATEPGTRDIERACWWIKAQALPCEEVQRFYGLDKRPDSDVLPIMYPSGVKELARLASMSDLCLVLTYYERPNRNTPQGRVVTVVGDRVVDGPHPWPFPFVDRLNVVCVRETHVEGRWYGDTVLSDAVPIQTAINHSWTSILEHMKQAGNARIQGNVVERANAEMWTDEAGEFVFYNVTPFQWLSPPQMPDWWQSIPVMLSKVMDDVLGEHDVTRGAAPPNVESGLGLSILAENDDTPVGKLARSVADAFAEAATMILRIYEAKVLDEQRSIVLYEPGMKIAESIRWNGESFHGQTIVEVPHEAVTPMSDSARWARALGLMDRGIISSPRQLATYLDIPSEADFIESIDPNVAKARRENAQMALGEVVIPAEWDNHKIHIEEHNTFRLSPRYERLGDREREILDLHIQGHSTLAAEEAGMQVAKTQMPGLAQAAQASQPPGSGMLDEMLSGSGSVSKELNLPGSSIESTPTRIGEP